MLALSRAVSERGLIIHKLIEELLTGETGNDPAVLVDRATTLVQALGHDPVDDPAKGLSAVEIAGCITRTMALPEIAELRPMLVPELPVYASTFLEGVEHATAGITDATGFASDGTLKVIIDWKSDVDPAPEAVEHYRAQVTNYLLTTGAQRGRQPYLSHRASSCPSWSPKRPFRPP